MSYVTKNLMRGEVILSRARVHWIVLVIPSAILVFIGLPPLLSSLTDSNIPIVSAIVCCCIFGIPLFIAMLNRVCTELVVTDKRVIGKRGIIARDAFAVSLSKVEGAQIRQSILGRIFGFGDLQIRGTGTGDNTYKYIVNPVAFQKIINQAIADYCP